MNEKKRLLAHRKRKANWKQWGPYLSERSWGTVREGENSTFDEAHKRPYRWGEDGLGGISDRGQYLCLAFALWNGKDPILKERLFGLNTAEGNHGEDVKESYFYLDATPTSSYLKMVYHYPQGAFPYEQLREENGRRNLSDPEYELADTGIFKEDRYFDVLFEYAKEKEEDIFCRVTVTNRGKESAPLTLLPTLWFRNTWDLGFENGPTGDDGGKPNLRQEGDSLLLDHPVLGTYYAHFEREAELLFTENETGRKDAFHKYVVNGESGAVNPEKTGTKAAALYTFEIPGGSCETITLSLTREKKPTFPKKVFETRIKEANQFYASIQKKELPARLKLIQREAFAGLLFSKQFYYLDQPQWEKESSIQRNHEWGHLTTFDILSMPDKWEFPYFCAWDTAFQALPMVMIDPDFAKRQLELMTREWYMHPNGQFSAYEWAFSDVNPPVQAWAIWRVYKIDGKAYGKLDRPFLEGLFHKLLLNFTWWVNKKDEEGNNIFQGGFLGMDNISVFDRSSTLPTGGHIDQSDGSAWMSFYCLEMLKISIHLSEEEPIYQDMATKFFEHFLRIASAMTHCGGEEKHHSLWDEEDGFFYDMLHLPNDEIHPLKVRSLVGLLPLLAVETLETKTLKSLPVLSRRMEWFLSKRPDMSSSLACIYEGGCEDRRLLSIVTKERLLRILTRLFDEEEFLSPFGIRSLSKYHEKHPYSFNVDGNSYEVKYVPGESDNEMFGGNSNWRGPIWFPINFLLIESLQKYHHYYGDELKLEFPTGSGNHLTLWEISRELSKRLITLLTQQGESPLFYEYFNAETGQGLGASHQTGWTALVAKLIHQSGDLF